jgi:hypothetical protein
MTSLRVPQPIQVLRSGPDREGVRHGRTAAGWRSYIPRGLAPLYGSHLRPVPGFSMLVETVPICVRASRAEGAGGQRLDESTFGESDSV